MPVHVKDPQLGPGASEAARLLFEHAKEEPDVVVVIYTKNIAGPDGPTGRTGVGTASRLEMTDEVTAFIVEKALKALRP